MGHATVRAFFYVASDPGKEKGGGGKGRGPKNFSILRHLDNIIEHVKFGLIRRPILSYCERNMDVLHLTRDRVFASSYRVNRIRDFDQYFSYAHLYQVQYCKVITVAENIEQG